jgi:hypothetical protein
MGQGLTAGFVTRADIKDGVVDLATLEANPFWEQDFITESWFRRTLGFFTERAANEVLLPGQCEAASALLATVLRDVAGELPPQADCPNRPGSPAGPLYMEVTSWNAGSLPEHFTYGDAIRAWIEKLRIFTSRFKPSDGVTLFWRVRPEVNGIIGFGETRARWRVYSRFAIVRT